MEDIEKKKVICSAQNGLDSLLKVRAIDAILCVPRSSIQVTRRDMIAPVMI